MDWPAVSGQAVGLAKERLEEGCPTGRCRSSGSCAQGPSLWLSGACHRPLCQRLGHSGAWRPCLPVPLPPGRVRSRGDSEPSGAGLPGLGFSVSVGRGPDLSEPWCPEPGKGEVISAEHGDSESPVRGA